MSTSTVDLQALGELLNSQDFDHPFTLTPQGEVRDADQGAYAPSVYNSSVNDVDIDGDGWEALTGLTGQYSYNGAVMHSSEFIGSQIAGYMLDLAEGEPQTFAVVMVEDLTEEDAEPIGWAILRRTEPVNHGDTARRLIGERE